MWKCKWLHSRTSHTSSRVWLDGMWAGPGTVLLWRRETWEQEPCLTPSCFALLSLCARWERSVAAAPCRERKRKSASCSFSPSLCGFHVFRSAVLASSSTNTQSKACFPTQKKHKHIKMASFFSFKITMNNVIKTYKNLLSLHIIYTRLKHLLKFLFSNFLFWNKTFSLILFKNVHFLNSSLVF